MTDGSYPANAQGPAVSGDAAFWAAYIVVPIVGFGALCLVDYRRRGRDAFGWLSEPELAIGLLAFAAWPLALVALGWLATVDWLDGLRQRREATVRCANCPHSLHEHMGRAGGCYSHAMDRSLPYCDCRAFERAAAL